MLVCLLLAGPIVYGFPAPSGLSSPPDSTVRTPSSQGTYLYIQKMLIIIVSQGINVHTKHNIPFLAAASSVMSSQSLPSPPSVDSETPSSVASGGHTLLTQSSSAMPSNILAPSYILATLGFVVLNYY